MVGAVVLWVNVGSAVTVLVVVIVVFGEGGVILDVAVGAQVVEVKSFEVHESLASSQFITGLTSETYLI